MKKKYLLLTIVVVLLVAFPLATGSIVTFVNLGGTTNVLNMAVLIPEANLKIAMTSYDPENKHAIFAIVKEGNVENYLIRDNVDVGVDLDLISGCYSPVQKVGGNSIEVAFACTDRPKMLLLANSIDYSRAGSFIDYFDSRGVTVIHATAEQFNDLSYGYKQYQTIVILGGQDAPEGIGEITSQLLDSDHQEFLRNDGNRGMFDEGDRWGANSVVIFAGSDRYQTQKAHEENMDKFLIPL